MASRLNGYAGWVAAGVAVVALMIAGVTAVVNAHQCANAAMDRAKAVEKQQKEDVAALRGDLKAVRTIVVRMDKRQAVLMQKFDVKVPD